jgi:hypothetical protein
MALDNHLNGVLHIKYKRRCPVLLNDIVDEALIGCAHNDIAKAHAHIYNSLRKF